MALTTDARGQIADALNAAGILTFPVAPETITLPSVVIVPADPYIHVNRIGKQLRYEAAYELTCLAQATSNAAGLINVEALLDRVLVALPGGVQVRSVSRPLLDDLGAQGAAFVCQITVAAQLEAAPVLAAVPPPAEESEPERNAQ